MKDGSSLMIIWSVYSVYPTFKASVLEVILLHLTTNSIGKKNKTVKVHTCLFMEK